MKKISLLLVTTLLISACQQKETSDKYMTADEMFNALFDDAEIRKICNVNTDKAKNDLLYNGLLDKVQVPTDPNAGNFDPLPVKDFYSFKELYGVINKSFQFPSVSGQAGLDPFKGIETSFGDADLRAGDIIIHIIPEYGADPYFDWVSLSKDIVLNYGPGEIIGTIGKVFSGVDIAQEFLPSPQSDQPESYTLADFGMKGINGVMMVIMGDVRNDGKNTTATILNIDFTIGSKGAMQLLKPRVLRNQLTYNVFQENATLSNQSAFNFVGVNADKRVTDFYNLVRHPLTAWVQDSGICENCTNQEFCSHGWQECIKKAAPAGYDKLLKPFLDNRECETRCNVPGFSCSEKKACLLRYGADKAAANAIDCPDDQPKVPFCDANPDICFGNPNAGSGGTGNGPSGGTTIVIEGNYLPMYDDAKNPAPMLQPGCQEVCQGLPVPKDDGSYNYKVGDKVRVQLECRYECDHSEIPETRYSTEVIEIYHEGRDSP